MNIGMLEVGPAHPCACVAEIGNAHNGNFSRAIRLLDAAKAAGASAAKLQTYTPAELVALRGNGPAPEPWGSQGWTMETLYEKARTPLEWIPLLFDHADGIGLPLFSSVFGAESLAVLEAAECPAYKIARIDNKKTAVRQAARLTGKPVLISSDEPDVTNRLDAWLYCAPNYPTELKDVHLPYFPDAGYFGISSHCLNLLLPIVAVARGAKMLEYHLQLDDEPSELEASVSLTASRFREMVERVKRVEGMLAA